MKRESKFTIWIVEDDHDDRILLTEAFADTKIPCSVLVLSDAMTAIRQLGISRIDQFPQIIITDYNMPIMNGAEFIEVLIGHKRYDQIKKIVLSTSQYFLDRSQSLKQGADAYFVKPCNYVELVQLALSILVLHK